MDIDEAIRAAIFLLPERMGGAAAKLMLRAINRQENPQRLEQQVNGPARGDYQFEKSGGVKGVMTHSAASEHTMNVCKARGVAFKAEAIYQAIGTDPVLAAALARILLWTDSKPMPAIGDAEGAWGMYLRVWRPGAYDRDPQGLHDKFLTGYAFARRAMGV
jgi:hypothetical protein